MFNLSTIIGTLGASFVLVCFIGLKRGFFAEKSFYYNLGNFFGSFLLMISAIMINNYPFIVLNLVWSLFAGFDAVRIFLRKR